jgi:hypothetical protein
VRKLFLNLLFIQTLGISTTFGSPIIRIDHDNIVGFDTEATQIVVDINPQLCAGTKKLVVDYRDENNVIKRVFTTITSEWVSSLISVSGLAQYDPDCKAGRTKVESMIPEYGLKLTDIKRGTILSQGCCSKRYLIAALADKSGAASFTFGTEAVKCP